MIEFKMSFHKTYKHTDILTRRIICKVWKALFIYYLTGIQLKTDLSMTVLIIKRYTSDLLPVLLREELPNRNLLYMAFWYMQCCESRVEFVVQLHLLQSCVHRSSDCSVRKNFFMARGRRLGHKETRCKLRFKQCRKLKYIHIWVSGAPCKVGLDIL